MDRPLLAGIRVIDLTQYAPGPYATRLLCDLGAEIIKIEPLQGDPMRTMFNQDPHSVSPIYRYLNKGKQISRIDLKDARVVQNLKPLIEKADVMLESFRPGVMERLGMDKNTCHDINPGLVYCSLSGYGQDGPSKHRAGHDINYCAAAGFYSFTENPSLVFPLVADHSGSMNAVNAILAALVARSRTGRGRYLDISLCEAILSWQYPALLDMAEQSGDELQLLSGGAACYNIYSTLDNRHITLGALEEKFWANFCLAVDREDWIARQYESFPQSELIQEVHELISRDTLKHWYHKLKEVDCCFEPIPLPDEILEHPQTRARGLFHRESLAYPGKFDQDACSNDDPLEDLEPAQIPCWRE